MLTKFFLTMVDNVTSQNIDLSFWITLYISAKVRTASLVKAIVSHTEYSFRLV